MIKFTEMPVSELIPYTGNARKHDEKNVAEIAASINEYGFNDPIAVNEKDNVIIEGHGRLLAAQKLGIEKIPVIQLGHLSPAQIKGYTLIHNRLAEKSEWDKDILQNELEKLGEMDFNLDAAGFDALSLEDLDIEVKLPGDEHPDYDEEKQDEIPEVAENELGVKRGDLWLFDPYWECDKCKKTFPYKEHKEGDKCPNCG